MTADHLLNYIKRMLEQMLAFVNEELKDNERNNSTDNSLS